MGMRIFFRLISFALFRWGGEYTWTTTGPTAYGRSEPLPLPTTIVGAILTTLRGVKPSAELDDAVEALYKALGCKEGSSLTLRGPYYPWREGIAVHVYPQKLLLIDGDGRIRKLVDCVDSVLVSYRGTALREDTKSVVRSLLYSVSLVDAKGLEREGIVPELSIDTTCEVGVKERRLSTKLGGDMRLAIMSFDNNTKLLNVIEKLSNNVEHLLTVSPILIDLRDVDTVDRFIHGEEKLDVDGCILRVPNVSTVRNLLESMGIREHKVLKHYVKCLRVRVELLSPGVYGDTGFPRKPYLAILPGSLLVAEDCGKDHLLRGVGIFKELGFRTLLPLRGV